MAEVPIMTVLTTARERTLARELQILARERLLQSLNAIAHCHDDEAVNFVALDELLIVPLESADPKLLRDGYLLLRDTRRPPRPIRLLLLNRVAEMRRLLKSTDLP